jgi:BirA family biotin operon repressor/biotin-[acetyl-CoA-carboxylase] ligase
MWILSDCPERLSDLLGECVSWEQRDAATLSGPERDLLRALGVGPTISAHETDEAGADDFWTRVVIVGDAPGSQFDALQEALRSGLELDGPLACWALSGRKFHGQRERPWAVSQGNLFLTVAFPLHAKAADVAPSLVMLPAVAVVDAVQTLPGLAEAPTIKWVNDIFLGGRKVAGVLAASSCLHDEIQTAVLGIGVNVVQAPVLDPTPFVPAAGSLKDAGARVSLTELFWTVLEKLADRYRTLRARGPADLLQAYRNASLVTGRRVRVWPESANLEGTPETWPPPLVAGVVRSIEADLSLRVEGHEETINKGRLALDEACDHLNLTSTCSRIVQETGRSTGLVKGALRG